MPRGHKAAYINREDLLLRQKKFELLLYLAKHENQAITKGKLLEEVWGYDYYEDMNTLNVHIHRICEKLEQHHYTDYYIQTVWGLGYKFERGETKFDDKTAAICSILLCNRRYIIAAYD